MQLVVGFTAMLLVKVYKLKELRALRCFSHKYRHKVKQNCNILLKNHSSSAFCLLPVF